MNIQEFVPKQEVQCICQELGIQDWTELSTAPLPLEEVKIIQNAVGGESLQVSASMFKQGLEVELEHGIRFPDANVTNNHPILTGMIVLAHLKEMLDYYFRLEVAELEGDLLKALKAGNTDKVSRLYRKLLIAKSELSDQVKYSLDNND